MPAGGRKGNAGEVGIVQRRIGWHGGVELEELRHAGSAGVASMATPLFGTAAHTVAVRLAFCAGVGRLPTTTIVIMGASKTGAFATMAERAATFSGAAGAANAFAMVMATKAAATKTNSMFFAMFISLLRFVDCEHIMETDEI